MILRIILVLLFSATIANAQPVTDQCRSVWARTPDGSIVRARIVGRGNGVVIIQAPGIGTAQQPIFRAVCADDVNSR